MSSNKSKASGQRFWRPAMWRESNAPVVDGAVKSPMAQRVRSWLRTMRNRAILGVITLIGLFLLYRAVWLTSWYWPYRLLHSYLAEQLPMAAPWAINTMAMLMALLIFAQGAALLSFVLWGKHRRETLLL